MLVTWNFCFILGYAKLLNGLTASRILLLYHLLSYPQYSKHPGKESFLRTAGTSDPHLVDCISCRL